MTKPAPIPSKIAEQAAKIRAEREAKKAKRRNNRTP